MNHEKWLQARQHGHYYARITIGDRTIYSDTCSVGEPSPAGLAEILRDTADVLDPHGEH